MFNETVIRNNRKEGPAPRGSGLRESRRIASDEMRSGPVDPPSVLGPGSGQPCGGRSRIIVVARYADGRPACLSDGSVIRYTAGGRAVRLPTG